ncbi:hypothetical protein [Streptomyces spirodelae]|uniref:hypothetical protein n=1 Tax=Streptomyces spirodelae TaxID=2812904 RepID=UPI001E5ADAB2|nr:hypothetical protein [Streptomyces spirodelae]
MARQPNPDLTNALTMLHTAVVHTDKNFRDALDKSVEKLESANRAAHDKTAKEVVDELNRMRTNFREVYNRLNSNGEALNTTVQDVVTQLRTELREVRGVLADLNPPTSPRSPTRTPPPRPPRRHPMPRTPSPPHRSPPSLTPASRCLDSACRGAPERSDDGARSDLVTETG